MSRPFRSNLTDQRHLTRLKRQRAPEWYYFIGFRLRKGFDSATFAGRSLDHGEHAVNCGELEALQRRASLKWEEYRADLLANPDAIELPIAQLQENLMRIAQIESQRVGFSVVIPKALGNRIWMAYSLSPIVGAKV